MTLTDVTPLVLTFNEAPNLERTLDRLRWATRVVVLDSGSTDGTLAIAARFPNVEVIHRPFDTHVAQWSFGLAQVRTEWTLALDADFVLSTALVAEVEHLVVPDDVAGYVARFSYCVDGKPLRGTLYPDKPFLFRTARGRFVQDGHAHIPEVDGRCSLLRAPIYHDDRKPRARWLANQAGYAVLEAAKLRASDPAGLGFADRLRRRGLAPLIVPLYCLLAKRLALDGRAGLRYTYERTYAELLLAFHILDRRSDSDHA